MHLPTGCYDEETHECDCAADRDECNASESGFMTSLCNAKCRDQAGFMPGCLDFDEDGNHSCNCSISEEACKADELDIWTDSCDCSVEPVRGCYNNDDGTCDCEATESECEAKEGSHNWSGLCTNKCIEGDNIVTGCLIFEEDGKHACNCDVPESACTSEEGEPARIWTESCACYPGCYDGETHECDCDLTREECAATESGFFTAMCDSKCEDPGRHKAGCLRGFTDLDDGDDTEGAHKCDCSIKTEEECESDPDALWTDACQCYTPAGCYDISIHKCDCMKTEAECLGGNVEGDDSFYGGPQFYWTDTCIGTDNAGCGYEENDIRPSGDAPGCFNIDLHKCNCALTEEECQSTDDEVTWIPECNCPARDAELGPV